jgi:hypothetical protein
LDIEDSGGSGRAYLFTIGFPQLPLPAASGLDPSWVYAINRAAADHRSLGRALVRSPVVRLEVSYSDGKWESHRFVPALAQDGLWIGYLPRNLDDVERLLSGRPLRPVRSFRIVSRHPELFESPVRIQFQHLPTEFGADADQRALVTH